MNCFCLCKESSIAEEIKVLVQVIGRLAIYIDVALLVRRSYYSLDVVRPVQRILRPAVGCDNRHGLGFDDERLEYLVELKRNGREPGLVRLHCGIDLGRIQLVEIHYTSREFVVVSLTEIIL